jgi:hypothetical protein
MIGTRALLNTGRHGNCDHSGGRYAGEGEPLESAVIYAKPLVHERTATVENEWNSTRLSVGLSLAVGKQASNKCANMVVGR